MLMLVLGGSSESLMKQIAVLRGICPYALGFFVLSILQVLFCF